MNAVTRPPVMAGDVITLTATVKQVRLDGHVAVVDSVYGDIWIPLPGPNALPDPQVVVEQAPDLQEAGRS